MSDIYSLRIELKNQLNEVLSMSRKREEALRREKIEYILEKIRNFVNRNISIIEEIRKLPQSVQKYLDQKFSDNVESLCEEIIKVSDYIYKLDDITSETFRNKFIELLKESYEKSNNGEKICDEQEEMLRESRRNFIGRESEQIGKLINRVVEMKDNFEEIKRLIDDLINDLKNKKVWISPEIDDLLCSLELGEGIWAHEFIEKISGLRSVAGEPYTEEVSVEAPFHYDEEAKRLIIDQLFARYPPFEPIQVEYEKITGRFVWFMEPNNATFVKPKIIRLNESVSIDNDRGKLISVRLFDVLKDFEDGEIVIRIRTASRGSFRNLFVKYGSNNLRRKLLDAQKDGIPIKDVIKKTQNSYKQYVQTKKKTDRVYSVSNLGYVWYCLLGLGMSTDPYDLDCPFTQHCGVGRAKQGKCDKWSWSRRLFPKVYVVPERELSLVTAAEYEPLLFIKPIAAVGVRIHELYKRAQWYMPSVTPEGPVVEVHFEKMLKKDLPKTNVVGFEIPLPLIRATVESLFDKEAKGKPEVAVMHGTHNLKVSLDKLLLSKYFIYTMTKKGLDTFTFLRMKDDKIINKFKKFQKRYDRDELINFIVDVLGHTLAHLLHAYVSSMLEIEPENLLYVYKVDKERNALVVVVAENSAWGSLNIVRHVEARFGSVTKMLEEFVNSTIKFLSDHEKDVHDYMTRVNKVVTDPKVVGIANELRRIYASLVKNGIIMDTATFLNHIVLSEQDFDIAEKLRSQGLIDDVKELRRRLPDAIVLSGINMCVDGCPACVMQDHGCTAPLLQNFLLSRNLAVWVLKVLSGRESIKGRGCVLGWAIFNQAGKIFFAFSPYLDEEGVKMLADLARRGVKVVLVTREEAATKFGEQLKEHGADVYVTRAPRHDKFYLIDGRVQVITTQNLCKLSSINEFLLKQLSPEEAERITRQELEGGSVERYKGGSS